MKNGISKLTVKKFLIPTIAITAVIISAIGGYTLSIKSKVEKWQDKIFPGVTINQIDVSGKNKDEAIELLTSKFDKIKDKDIIVNAKDNTFNLSFSDIEVHYNIEETVEIALNSGKDEELFSQNKWIKGKNNKDIETHFTYNEDIIDKFKEEIKATVNTEPKDAKLTLVGSNISVSDSSNGYTIDEEELDRLIVQGLESKDFNDININLTLKETKPRVSKEVLSKVNGIIGSFTTNYVSTPGRDTNLKLATQFCNGKVLMPGEIFSYNETVGKRTYERGFKDGGVFVDNKLVQDVGGGICQVSTTLYRAAMRSNLRSVERYNHSKLTSYSEPALDATVAWGALDYKFKNTYNSPIYIQGIFGNGKVTFNIFGNVEEKGDKIYDIVNEIVGKIPPKEVKIKDPKLPKGKTKVINKGSQGVKAKSYFVTYHNGKEISKEHISTDIYNGNDKEIAIGTGKEK